MNKTNKEKYGHKSELYLLMILKDEEKSIEETILAFHENGDDPLYDHLIVGIDNNTTDKTEEIVRKYTDDVHFFDWEENFSLHRNWLIDKAPLSTDEQQVFLLFPDGHEVMRPHGKAVLHKFLSEPPTNANAFAPYIEIDCDDYDIPDVVFSRPIFFRNTGNVRFERGVHNYLFDKDKTIVKMPQLSFKHNMHPKRKEMRREMRADMNIRRLQETTKANPNDARDIFYLGDAYEESGKYNKAMEYYTKTFELTDNVDPDLAAQVCICALNLSHKIKKYDRDARLWAYRGIRNRFERAELYYYLGLLLSKDKKDKEAIHWYKIAASMPLPNSAYFLMGKVYTWFPYDGLMVSYNAIGDLENSLLAAKKIIEWKKDPKTGKPCPVIMRNIRSLEEGIANKEKSNKAKQLMAENQELVKKAAEQIGEVIKKEPTRLQVV